MSKKKINLICFFFRVFLLSDLIEKWFQEIKLLDYRNQNFLPIKSRHVLNILFLHEMIK